MENYKIIADEDRLKEFIEWLPELATNETYYLSLVARNKYSSTQKFKNGIVKLKRFTSNKKYLFNKIRQLECPYGAYENEGEPIQQESLALYIHPNPRSLKIAAKNGAIELIKMLSDGDNTQNPHQLMMNAIQVSKQRTTFISYDFDLVTLDYLKEKLNGSVNMDAITFVQTRGGYHILLNPRKIDKYYIQTFHNTICKIEGRDVKGDAMLPVVGAYQGGFIPKLIMGI